MKSNELNASSFEFSMNNLSHVPPWVINITIEELLTMQATEMISSFGHELSRIPWVHDFLIIIVIGILKNYFLKAIDTRQTHATFYT